MRVRITETPRERELDGVALDTLQRGTVHDVSSLLGSWLVTQGYAQVEMRQGGGAPPVSGRDADGGDGHVPPGFSRRGGIRRRRTD
ncbi:MAG TPA: hypothetical protein VGY48_12290 [Vicinamibacterales bacterium]|nr:hypothetical protein [Vicinamibacterales bacterium]